MGCQCICMILQRGSFSTCKNSLSNYKLQAVKTRYKGREGHAWERWTMGPNSKPAL